MSVPLILKKLGLSISALVICFGIPAMWLWYTFAGPGYYAEFNDIKARIDAMPDVELIRAGGNQDMTYEDIWAEIFAKGKGRITLFALTRTSFNDTEHMFLGAIGPYNIIVEGKGHFGAVKTATDEPVRLQFYGGAIDIGAEGTFAQFFPFAIRNVDDVIARYDDISAIIARWPVEPDSEHFKDEEGTDYYYYVEKIPPKDGRVFSEPAPHGTPSEEPSP